MDDATLRCESRNKASDVSDGYSSKLIKRSCYFYCWLRSVCNIIHGRENLVQQNVIREYDEQEKRG